MFQSLISHNFPDELLRVNDDLNKVCLRYDLFQHCACSRWARSHQTGTCKSTTAFSSIHPGIDNSCLLVSSFFLSFFLSFFFLSFFLSFFLRSFVRSFVCLF